MQSQTIQKEKHSTGRTSLNDALSHMVSRAQDSEGVVYGDRTPVVGSMLATLLEGAAETEVERRTGRPLHARGTEAQPHLDYRNGYRRRTLQFQCGSATIRLPRVRMGGFVPTFLLARCRALPEVSEWMYQALMCGISVSELSRLMERVTGFRPSAGLLAETRVRPDGAG